jgi:hypothetical protein
MASSMAALRCYGGPLDGHSATIAAGSRFGWLVNNRLVSNTETTEFAEIKANEGIYVRVTQHGVGRHNANREILMWKPTPGIVPTMQ